MSKASLYEPFVWHQYSKKLKRHILEPKYVGLIQESQHRVVIGWEESFDRRQEAKLYLQIEKESGKIIDARFQLIGESVLIGIFDALCDILKRRNILQAKRLTAGFLEKSLQDQGSSLGVPKLLAGHLNFVMNTLDMALEQCDDISIKESYDSTPLDIEMLEGSGYQDWETYNESEQLGILQKTLDEEILPFVELDGGSVKIKELLDGKRLFIEFSGNCGTCPSSQTSTLNAISSILRAKVHQTLQVIPILQTH